MVYYQREVQVQSLEQSGDSGVTEVLPGPDCLEMRINVGRRGIRLLAPLCAQNT